MRDALAASSFPGTAESIVAGPVPAAQVWWWQVRFDTGTDGWSAERNISDSRAEFERARGGGRPGRGNPPSSSGFASINPSSGSTVDWSSLILRGSVTDHAYAGGLIAFR